MTLPNPGDKPATAVFAGGTARRFVRDAGEYLPATLLPSIFAIIAVTIFTRVFNPIEYGLYSLALAIIGPLVDFVAETIGQPTSRYYAEYERSGLGGEFRRSVGLLTAAGCAFSLLIGVVSGTIFLFFTHDVGHLWLFAGAAALGLVQVAAGTVVPILRSSLRPRPFRFATIVSSGLFVLLGVLFVQAPGRNVAVLLWAQVIANAVMLPYIYRHANVPLFLSSYRPTPDMRVILNRFLRYGVPMMLWFVASNILHREDVYVIGWFRGSGEVGLYTVNYNIVFAISGLINTPVLLAAGPILYHQWGNRLFGEAENTIMHMTELYVILGLPFIGGIYALGTPLVAVILGAQFRAGASILVPVAIGRALWGVANVGHKGLELSEKPLIIAGSALAAGALNLGLNIIFVPIYGYIAAAYVTLASYAAYSLLIWWQSKSYVPWRINLKGMWRYCIPTVVATAATVEVCGLFPAGANVQCLAVGGTLFVALYGLLTVWLAGAHMKALFVPTPPA